MRGGRQEVLVPCNLPVIMSVGIDEARRHEPAGCVHLLSRGVFDSRRDPRNPSVDDCEVGLVRRCTRAVDNGAVLQDNIVRELLTPLPRLCGTAYAGVPCILGSV